jgi:iron-sulfur cluster repair protein YtfE (RIC family)
MSVLIDELKSDHAKLVAVLTEVKALGPQKGMDILRKAKASLLAHLGKEDKKLYPILKKAAETDASVKSTLDIFASDMDKISKAALDFFAKYENGNPAGLDFAKDYGALMFTLSNRIRKEEDVLYPLFEKISQGKKAA